MFRFVKFCECFGIWILELCFFLDGGVWKFWILKFEILFFFVSICFAVSCFHDLFFLFNFVHVSLDLFDLFCKIYQDFSSYWTLINPYFSYHIFSLQNQDPTIKSEPHYKIRILSHFCKSQQQGQKSTN